VGAPSSLSASPSSAGPNNAKTDLQTAEAKPRVVDVTAEDYVMPRLPTAVVTLVGRANQPVTVEVEVAATRDARTRGLMWRYTLVEGMGMLFIFTRDQPLSFWMRNTLIPLDMLFIDSKGKVVSIVENAEPKTLSSRASTGPAMYVLEVPGGWCAKAGVKAGSHVSFQGVTNIVPEE
jgi:uncharacterized membrane protein (UPF0127 family)